jgi:hypothetical protein
MGAPRAVDTCEGENAHAHYATAKHYYCLTYTVPLQVTHALCLCRQPVSDEDSSNAGANSGTDTEDVESFMPNFVSVLCG